jgi:diguanylate cyclase (GGDEF)-like protein
MIGAWREEIDRIVTEVESVMVTVAGLSSRLRELIRSPNSPVAAVVIEVSPDERHVLVGTPGEGEAHRIDTVPLRGSRHKLAKIRIWLGDPQIAREPGAVESIIEQVGRLFMAWWTPEARSEKGDLPTYSEAMKRRGQGALRRQRALKKPFTLIFFDLDNFKAINNALGQAGGDKIIARLAGFVENLILDDAVVVHHGGDEFILVLPDGDDHDAIELSARILVQAGKYDFEAGGGKIGISLGIASAKAFPDATFEELVDIADKEALKRLVKRDPNVKGAMRVAAGSMGAPDEVSGFASGALALLLRKSLGSAQIEPMFASVWLNALVKVGWRSAREGKQMSEIATSILEAFNTFRIPLGAENLSLLPFGACSGLEPSLSAIDIAAGCARVILEVFTTKSDSEVDPSARLLIRSRGACVQLILGEVTICSVPNPVSIPEDDIDLGVPWHGLVAESESVHQVDSSPFILLEVGRNHLRLLPKLAADHIVIDDRPVKGGGLPDFWEFSLSRLISSLGRFPNVKLIVMLGDRSNARRIVEKLESAAVWDVDYIAYKTAVPKTQVEAARLRLVNGVKFYSEEVAALDELVSVATSPCKLERRPPGKSDEPPVLLRRRLDHGEAALGWSDGCRVRTAAEAYPLMLELIRTGPKASDDSIVDQDGVRLREIVDFKVVVEDPVRDQVPFFFRREQAALSEYFDTEFVRDNGRFVPSLRASGAEERVLAHVHWALTRPDGPPFATRRALLVVPHVPQDRPESVAPLGLVSVRICPRPGPVETVVNFSFTWRTVEALIGFPYSLYGSLRYAQTLCGHLESLPRIPRIRLGYVSYVAHSLHFFLSDESNRLARGIVSESSA